MRGHWNTPNGDRGPDDRGQGDRQHSSDNTGPRPLFEPRNRGRNARAHGTPVRYVRLQFEYGVKTLLDFVLPVH